MSITAAQVVAAFNNIKNIIEQLPKVQKESVDAAKQAADEQVKASLKDSGYVSPKIIASNIKANVNKDLVAAASNKPTEKGMLGSTNKDLVVAVGKKATQEGTPPPETGQAPSTQGGTRAKTYKRRGTRRKKESKK